MRKHDASEIVSEEIRRLREEAEALDRQIEEWRARRIRLQLLISILEAHRGRPPAVRDTVVRELPLDRTSHRKSDHVPSESPDRPSTELRVGLPARMLEGIYAGLEGVIRWCRESPRGMICTLSLRSPTGRSVRTQVTERSLGRKWELIQEPSESGREERTAPTSKSRRSGRPPKVRRRTPPAPRRATRPEELLPRNTRVKVLKGKYAGWEGFISGIRDKGTAITYALSLEGPGGEEGRTQVNHGSLGDSWVILDRPVEVREEAPSPPPKVVRRRPLPVSVVDSEATSGDRTAEDGSASSGTDAGEQTSSGPSAGDVGPATRGTTGTTTEAPARYTPSSPILAEKTQIRMLAGPYLGHTGVIVRVQKHPGPKADALYTILIETGPDGETVFTSARHSSLGRSWTVL